MFHQSLALMYSRSRGKCVSASATSQTRSDDANVLPSVGCYCTRNMAQKSERCIRTCHPGTRNKRSCDLTAHLNCMMCLLWSIRTVTCCSEINKSCMYACQTPTPQKPPQLDEQQLQSQKHVKTDGAHKCAYATDCRCMLHRYNGATDRGLCTPGRRLTIASMPLKESSGLHVVAQRMPNCIRPTSAQSRCLAFVAVTCRSIPSSSPICARNSYSSVKSDDKAS